MMPEEQQQPLPRDEKLGTAFLEFDNLGAVFLEFDKVGNAFLEFDKLGTAFFKFDRDIENGPTRGTVSSDSTINSDSGTMTSAVERDGDSHSPVVIVDGASPYVVDWDGDDDPKNPQNWSLLRKWVTIALVSAITFVTSFASTIFAPGVPLLMREFESTDGSLSSFVVSVYIIGFCLGPLVLAPLSEHYGRSPIMHSSNIFFLIFSVACAVSSSLPMFIVFRLLAGIAGCPPLTLGGGFIADLIPPQKRGKALSIWTMGPLLGPVLGPVIGGFMAQRVGWRWSFWLVVILTGVLMLASFVLLRETYAPVLLEAKARALRKETGNMKLRSKFDKGQTARQLFLLAIVRPTKMLISSPIVFLLALEMSIVYSYIYFMFTTFAYVFQSQYGFGTSSIGLAYLGLGVGFFIGQFGIGAVSDRLAVARKATAGSWKPEHRLPPSILGSLLIPIGLLWYGWAAERNAHWIVPIIGTSLVGIGTIAIFLPVQMYLIEAFGIYAASALATNTIVRSLFGATLPLAGQPLYNRLGLGWGNSLLAFIALALSPSTFFLLKYGERIRTSPRFQLKL